MSIFFSSTLKNLYALELGTREIELGNILTACHTDKLNVINNKKLVEEYCKDTYRKQIHDAFI